MVFLMKYMHFPRKVEECWCESTDKPDHNAQKKQTHVLHDHIQITFKLLGQYAGWGGIKLQFPRRTPRDSAYIGAKQNGQTDGCEYGKTESDYCEEGVSV